MYDTDVIFLPDQIKECVEKLREGDSKFGLPYGGHTHFIKGAVRTSVINTLDIESVPTSTHPEVHLENPASVGGATFFDREYYLSVGGYNEKFIAWGFEDNEIVKRFTVLGQPPFRIPGRLIHLCHRRGIDSGPTHNMYSHNQEEFNKINAMNKEQLENYIKMELI